jgi:hypothetical protein
MMRTSAAVVTTRPLDVVSRELDRARTRRAEGREDAGRRWEREALEAEFGRAKEAEKSRSLTEYEGVKQVEFLQQLVSASEARINERFASFEKMFVESLGECFGRERRKLRTHIEEQITKTRTGPAGQRGERGARGDVGARGPEGRAGPKGDPGDGIVTWKIDRAKYTILPIFEDGTPGAPIELKQLFEQFIRDVK